MNNLSPDIKCLICLLKKYKVEFAVCGGHAVAFHGYPRMTMDVDLLIEPSEKNADRVMSALVEFGFGDAGIPKNAFLKEGTAITLGVQPNQVDLLTSISGESTAKVMVRTIIGELDGIKIRFICLSDLMEAKRQAARPKDLADLDELTKMNTVR